MFNKQTHTGSHRILSFVCVGEFLAFWLCLRLLRLDMRRFVPLAPRILQEPARRQRRGFVSTKTFVMETPGIGVAQVRHEAIFHIDHAGIVHAMSFVVPL